MVFLQPVNSICGSSKLQEHAHHMEITISHSGVHWCYAVEVDSTGICTRLEEKPSLGCGREGRHREEQCHQIHYGERSDLLRWVSSILPSWPNVADRIPFEIVICVQRLYPLYEAVARFRCEEVETKSFGVKFDGRKLYDHPVAACFRRECRLSQSI